MSCAGGSMMSALSALESYYFRISTGQLNRLIQDAIFDKPHVTHGRRIDDTVHRDERCHTGAADVDIDGDATAEWRRGLRESPHGREREVAEASAIFIFDLQLMVA